VELAFCELVARDPEVALAIVSSPVDVVVAVVVDVVVVVEVVEVVVAVVSLASCFGFFCLVSSSPPSRGDDCLAFLCFLGDVDVGFTSSCLGSSPLRSKPAAGLPSVSLILSQSLSSKYSEY